MLRPITQLGAVWRSVAPAETQDRSCVPDWQSLPESCWVLVFQELSPGQRAIARLACKQFQHLGALWHTTARVSHLDHTDAQKISYLATLPKLSHVSVDTTDTIFLLQHLTRLTSLHIYAGTVGDFSPLTSLLQLQSLSLERHVPRPCLAAGCLCRHALVIRWPHSTGTVTPLQSMHPQRPSITCASTLSVCSKTHTLTCL